MLPAENEPPFINLETLFTLQSSTISYTLPLISKHPGKVKNRAVKLARKLS